MVKIQSNYEIKPFEKSEIDNCENKALVQKINELRKSNITPIVCLSFKLTLRAVENSFRNCY